MSPSCSTILFFAAFPIPVPRHSRDTDTVPNHLSALSGPRPHNCLLFLSFALPENKSLHNFLSVQKWMFFCLWIFFYLKVHHILLTSHLHLCSDLITLPSATVYLHKLQFLCVVLYPHWGSSPLGLLCSLFFSLVLPSSSLLSSSAALQSTCSSEYCLVLFSSLWSGSAWAEFRDSSKVLILAFCMFLFVWGSEAAERCLKTDSVLFQCPPCHLQDLIHVHLQKASSSLVRRLLLCVFLSVKGGIFFT